PRACSRPETCSGPQERLAACRGHVRGQRIHATGGRRGAGDPRRRTSRGPPRGVGRVILLDTDHVTLLKYPANDRGARLAQRLEVLPAEEDVVVAIVSVEEQMRGWLVSVAKERSARRQVGPYRELANLFDFFAEFTIALFDEPAADRFDDLRAA